MGDFLKNVPYVAFAPLLETFFSQFKAVKKRRSWNRDKRRVFGFLGVPHWIADPFSILVSTLIVAFVLACSFAFFLSNGLGWRPTTEYLKAAFEWNDANYAWILFWWAVHSVVLFANGFAWLFLGIEWLIPKCRQSIGFANAYWHAKEGEASPAIAITRDDKDRIAGELVRTLVTTDPNPNLALRPDGLTEEEAANVLFFGHVIECALTKNRIFWAPEIWTPFYKALGDLAKKPARPLTASAILAFKGASFHHDVIVKFNDHVEAPLVPLPTEYEIPVRIDQAYGILTTKFKGNAQNCGKALIGYSYGALMRRSKRVPQFDLEEIRRQFAKLAIIWNVLPNARQPKMFKIPFSRSIAAYLIDIGWLKTDSKRFSVDDSRFIIVFDRAQETLVSMAVKIIGAARDGDTTAWLAKSKQFANQNGLETAWYLRYRIDQLVYHLAKSKPSAKWKSGDRSIELQA